MRNNAYNIYNNKKKGHLIHISQYIAVVLSFGPAPTKHDWRSLKKKKKESIREQNNDILSKTLKALREREQRPT